MAKICMNCGNRCKEEAGFCPYCGTRFPVANDLSRNHVLNPEMDNNMAMQNGMSVQNTSNHSNKTTTYIVIALVSVLCVVILCMAIFIAYHLGKSDSHSSKDTSKSEVTKDLENEEQQDNEDYENEEEQNNEEKELENQLHDQTILSSIHMDINSACAVVGAELNDATVELSDLGDLVQADKADEFVNTYLELIGQENSTISDYSEWVSLLSDLALDEDGADGKIFVSADSGTGETYVFMTENHDPYGDRIEKLTVGSN